MKNFFFLSGLFFSGLFLSATESSAQWTAVDSGLTNGAVISFAIIPDDAGGSYLFAATDGGTFISTNNGTNWNESGNTGGTAFFTSCRTYDGTNNTHLFVAAAGGVIQSIYNGTSWTNWTAVSSVLQPFVWALAVSPNGTGGMNLFAGTHVGVFLSTFNGTNWTNWAAIDSGLTHTHVNALVVSPNKTGSSNLFAATKGGGVFLSTNNGSSWTPVNSGLTDTAVYALAMNDSNLFAGTESGHAFLSMNNGTSWTALGLTNIFITSFAFFPNRTGGTNLFAGTWGGGVYLSTNNGTNWTAVNSPLMNQWTWTLATSPDGTGSTYLLVGTEGGGAWRRLLSDMITSAEQPPSQLPKRFALDQNYPNPFNPTTKISYQLSVISEVSLKVYDLLGREVATLLSETLRAGRYTKQWNPINTPSGVYFYRLIAHPISATNVSLFGNPKSGTGGQIESFSQTKKLLYLK